MTQSYNLTCAYPGCSDKVCTRSSKFCSKHKGLKPTRTEAAKQRSAQLRLEQHRKDNCTYHGKQSICERCGALALCRVEIERPSFWPPCTPSSRFYDPALTGRLEAA